MKSSNRYTKYLAMVTASLLSGGPVKSYEQPKEPSYKRKKYKSCKYYKHDNQDIYWGYCRYKCICTRPLNIACDEYIKRKK